jgi:AAA+ ATPase superfamily predicted ATPase
VVDNPFRYGHVATGEHFADRARELDELVADGRGGQSVVVISPRRYGKTSLVLRARDRLVSEGVLVAYVDLFRATTRQRLVDELATALYRGVASPLERARVRALDLFRTLPVQPKLTLGQDGTPGLELSPLARAEDLDATF